MPDYKTNVTILLLGSEPVARQVMREVLEGAGYVVLAASDLSIAVQTLESYPIDLLMTHPYIADMPGHEAVKYLRTKKPGLAVLMIAGLLDDDRLQYRADLAHYAIFPAPFTPAQLIGKVQEILENEGKTHASK